jgi:hypothetical protein
MRLEFSSNSERDECALGTSPTSTIFSGKSQKNHRRIPDIYSGAIDSQLNYDLWRGPPGVWDVRRFLMEIRLELTYCETGDRLLICSLN